MKYSYNTYPSPGSSRVAYLLVPLEIGSDGLGALAEKYSTNIVEIIVRDWDDALTPWPAPGVFSGDREFAGDAASTLKTLRKSIIPKAEKIFGLTDDVYRQLVGVSLSGLFAVWAWMQGDDFKDIASISGSFWYDNFTNWLATDGKRSKDGFAYLSLGDKEGQTRIGRYKSVVAETARVESILKDDGAEVMFESTQGTHFAPMLPRFEKAMLQLSKRES